MRGDACTTACGFCGACTPEWDRHGDEQDPYFCDHCHKDVFGYRLSLASGTFCSTACADAHEATFQSQQRQIRRTA